MRFLCQLAAALFSITITAVHAQSLPAQLPTCDVNPSRHEPNFPSYLNDSLSQLKSAVPTLRSLKFEPQQTADLANSILEQAGEIIDTMVPRVPNLIADEQLSQARIALPYIVGGAAQSGSGAPSTGRGSSMQRYSSSERSVEGEELQAVLHTLLGTSHRNTFTYRISSTEDAVLGNILDENRVDAENHPVVLSGGGLGSPQAVGFSSTWLLFRPANLPKSRFRYLGREKLDGHETAVLAFAQIPELTPLPAQLGLERGNCSIFFQGIAWIDTSSFQIVRIQTDLLAPVSAIELQRLRSDVHFSTVRIEQRNLSLWLPSDAEIIWATKNQAGGELHRYTRYRLFGATSTIVIPK